MTRPPCRPASGIGANPPPTTYAEIKAGAFVAAELTV
jgi:hypothetical protein